MPALLQDLLNAGINPGDAKIIDDEYANQSDFLDGLEQIARILVVRDSPGLIPPNSEPWKAIHIEMVKTNDFDQSVDCVIGQLTPALQNAILGAIQTRMAGLQHWFQSAQNSGKKRKTVDYVKALGNLGFSFKYNLCTYSVECNGVPMTDPLAAEIRGKLRDHGMHEVNIVEDAYLAHAWQNRYHPIRDYLASLKWDGEDYISKLAGYFIDEKGVIETWLKRWLIGAVARVMAHEQNRMLVLDGKQGIGKDYFVKWLCSPMPEYYNEGPIVPDDKDHRIRLIACWIWDVNELGSTTRRSDREALKAFLTINVVKERKAWGRYDIQAPAITSFVGTANNEGGILNDPTGHRRFMIAKLKEIDWSYTRMDVDQIWAQAFSLYLIGETHLLKGDEAQLANDINEEYQTIDLVEETIKQHFVIDPDDKTEFLTTIEIIETLKDPLKGNLKAGTEIDTRKLASALTKLGLDRPVNKRIRSQILRGYYGISRRFP